MSSFPIDDLIELYPSPPKINQGLPPLLPVNKKPLAVKHTTLIPKQPIEADDGGCCPMDCSEVPW